MSDDALLNPVRYGVVQGSGDFDAGMEAGAGDYVSGDDFDALADAYDALAARVAELERAVLILRRSRAPLEKDVPQDVDGFLKWLASPDADGGKHGA